MPKTGGIHRTARATVKPANPGIVPYREIPAFLRALRRGGPADTASDALEWLILTATRPNETLDARLAEVSAKDAAWTLTAARIKSIRPRTVPLSARALAIFAARQQGHGGEGDILFEAAPGRPLNGAAMLMRMRRVRDTGVPHGFRYTFRRWAADNGYAPDALTKASFAELRKVMEAWANFCSGR